MAITSVFAEILKSQRDENGDLIVTGKATGPDLDMDQQRMDPSWLKSAMPKWFEIGNIREQHTASAAGVATELEQVGDDWLVTAKVVDPIAAKKVESDVYKGFSIGIKGAQIMKSANAPGGLITGGRIVEVSLTDRPCNPTCTLELAKSAVPGMKVKSDEFDRDRMLVKTETLVETPEVVEEVEVTAEDVAKFEDSDLGKRDVSTAERDKLASKGQALPDGSFPIANVGDLKNAVRAIGRAKDVTKAKAHIKKRAKALGKPDLVPESWKTESGEVEKGIHDSAELAVIRQGLVNCIQAELDELANGENEIWDIRELIESLCTFLCWWQDEAYEGEVEAPNMEKTSDEITHVTLSDDAEKAEKPDVTKAFEAKIEEIRNDFLAKLEASEETSKRLEAELTKMKSLPVPGGPVMTKTAVNAAESRLKDEALLKAERYEQLASAVNDRGLAQGYLKLANEHRIAAK